MPGYMMHLSEGRIMEKQLLDKGFLKEGKDLDLFRNGLLLPDTRLGADKKTTHFWNGADEGRLALAPDLKLFYRRYGDRLKEPVLLGYHAHLHLDHVFVKKFWPENFRFFDGAGQEQVRREKIKMVYLPKRGLTVPLDQFYSSEWYYGDYTRMNGLLIERYQVKVPEVIEGCAQGIDGVCEEKLYDVKKELNRLLCHPKNGEELKVFFTDELLSFLEKTAAEFLQLITSSKKAF